MFAGAVLSEAIEDALIPGHFLWESIPRGGPTLRLHGPLWLLSLDSCGKDCKLIVQLHLLLQEYFWIIITILTLWVIHMGNLSRFYNMM